MYDILMWTRIYLSIMICKIKMRCFPEFMASAMRYSIRFFLAGVFWIWLPLVMLIYKFSTSLEPCTYMLILSRTDWISISDIYKYYFFSFGFSHFPHMYTCHALPPHALIGKQKKKLFSYYVNLLLLFYCPNILKSSRAVVCVYFYLQRYFFYFFGFSLFSLVNCYVLLNVYESTLACL